MDVVILRPAQDELLALPKREHLAMRRALEKLAVIGADLGHPHTSAVKIEPGWRELRPRQGRSRWRAFYRRDGARLVVAAIGPEAGVNRREFERALRQAAERFATWQRGEQHGGTEEGRADV